MERDRILAEVKRRASKLPAPANPIDRIARGLGLEEEVRGEVAAADRTEAERLIQAHGGAPADTLTGIDRMARGLAQDDVAAAIVRKRNDIPAVAPPVNPVKAALESIAA